MIANNVDCTESNLVHYTNFKQECIPVGYVPAAAVAVSGRGVSA